MSDVKFSDTQKNPALEKCEGKLTDLHLGKEIVIKSYETVEIGTNQCSIIELGDGKKVFTFSAVIADQLGRMEETLKQGSKVSVKVIKEKNYYTFIDP